MKQGLGILTLIILPILLSGCLADSQAANAVSFETTFSGSGLLSGLLGNKKIEFFSSQTSYETAVAEYTAAPAGVIDFNNEQVVLLDIGGRPTGGYSIRVDSIAETNGVLTIYATEAYPGAGCMVSAALTEPYIFVRIFSAAQVETITIKQEATNCGAP